MTATRLDVSAMMAPTQAWQQVVLLAGFGALFMFLPLVTLLLICLLCVNGTGTRTQILFLASVCLLFSILNISKEIEGDLVNYVAAYEYFRGESVATFLDPRGISAVTPSYRAPEFGFYGGLWALSQLFDSSRVTIAVAGTLATYPPVYAGLRIIGKHEGWNDRLILVVAFVMFFLLMNFNLNTHLLRQNISGSIAFVGFAYCVTGRLWRGALLALTACTVHMGTVLVVGDFVVLLWLFPYGYRAIVRPWSTLLRVAVALLVYFATCVVIASRELTRLGLEETDITVWHFVAAGALFAAFILSVRLGPPTLRVHYYVRLGFIAIYAVALCYFVTGFSVLALRYFLYLQWLTGLMLAPILCTVPRRFPGSYLVSRWLACAVAVVGFLLRIHNSAWDYGPGTSDLFTANLFTVAGYMSN